MNPQTKQQLKTWNSVIVGMMILMVGVIIAELIIPKPTLESKSRENMTKQRDLRFANDATEKRVNEIEAEVSKLCYTGNVETVTPKILAQVNQIAAANKIEVKSFRPQKPLDFDGLQRLPFTVLASGKYSQIVSFVRQIDEQSTLFSVYLLQVSASDGETDMVSATIGMAAFIQPESEKASTKTASNDEKKQSDTTVRAKS